MISVEQLSVSYGSHRALGDVTLSVDDGRLLAIVGPSGSGKSTLLSSLNRLTDLVPGCMTTGRITIAGEEIRSPSCDLLALRRRVGMVFQSPNPLPMSIRRNFELPLREHGFARETLASSIEAALREVGLWDEIRDRLNHPATELSIGQQQRLCIARALALEPQVILFDEPCSSLDPLSAAKVEELIQSLKRRLTVVLVTHQIRQAQRLADDLAVLWTTNGSGHVIASGPAAQIFASPTDPLVADYLSR